MRGYELAQDAGSVYHDAGSEVAILATLFAEEKRKLAGKQL